MKFNYLYIYIWYYIIIDKIVFIFLRVLLLYTKLNIQN